MKKWTAAEMVELNINETAHGKADSLVEVSVNGWGTNNDLVDGDDSDGDGVYGSNGKIYGPNSSTPDTLS